MRLRRILALLLPLVLLIAQQGAFAHLASHAAENRGPAQEKALAHLKLCGKCASAEKLTHAATADAIPLAVASLSYHLLPVTRYAFHWHTAAVYRIRAPPVRS